MKVFDYEGKWQASGLDSMRGGQLRGRPWPSLGSLLAGFAPPEAHPSARQPALNHAPTPPNVTYLKAGAVHGLLFQN